jgi:hypothetical protein
MRVLKEEVRQIWKARKASLATDLAEVERRAKAIQATLDRLGEAFLFGGNCVRRLRACWNRRNRTGFQLLTGIQIRK